MKFFRIICLIIIAIGFSFFSCKKDKNLNKVILTGNVYEVGTSVRIPDALITVLRADADAFTSASYHSFMTTNTDNNGNYSLNFDYDDNYKYIMYSSDNGIHFNSDNQSINKGETQINIPQYTISYLSIHLKNTSPFDAYDKIAIYNSVWWGTDIDTVMFGQWRGGTTETVNWRVTKNGIQQHYNQTVLIPISDTAFININY